MLDTHKEIKYHKKWCPWNYDFRPGVNV